MFATSLILLTSALVLAWACQQISEPVHLIVVGLIGVTCFIASIVLAPWSMQLLLLVLITLHLKP